MRNAAIREVGELDHTQLDDFIGPRVQPRSFHVKEDANLDWLVGGDRRNNVPRHQTAQDPIVAGFFQRMRHLRKLVACVVGHVLALSD